MGTEVRKITPEKLDKIYENFSLKCRYLPAEGYKLSDDKTHFEKKAGGLEKYVTLILIISSILFLCIGIISFTGYSIFNSFENKDSNIEIITIIL